MSLFSMVTGLQNAEVRFVLIGGMAAVADGLPYATNDLDIRYIRRRTTCKRLPLLALWNAYVRGADEGLPFVGTSST